MALPQPQSERMLPKMLLEKKCIGVSILMYALPESSITSIGRFPDYVKGIHVLKDVLLAGSVFALTHFLVSSLLRSRGIWFMVDWGTIRLALGLS